LDPSTRTINLGNLDVLPSGAKQSGRDPAITHDFFTVPHEFGHAILYGVDEYEAGAAQRSDVKSLMNIGKEVRARHLQFVPRQLDAMFPGTKFSIPG
jgi:hypothetical protein